MLINLLIFKAALFDNVKLNFFKDFFTHKNIEILPQVFQILATDVTCACAALDSFLSPPPIMEPMPMMMGMTTHITPVSLGEIKYSAPIQPRVCESKLTEVEIMLTV